ncbi:MAG: Holliday junction branch migration protein RuvA [Burkholderiales bacterium]|nr:Holliday junction branch migration protein RuvA [Burkholderiales bacterium]
MIGRISGKLIEKHPPLILVDVQGVGYEIDVPMSTFYILPAVGELVSLHTHLAIREDAHVLYGFATQDERRVFRLLLKISGVGPKLALSVLSGLNLNDLADAVVNKEAARLIRIPGVGKKTAERLLLELQGKFTADGDRAAQDTAVSSVGSDIINALQALGYNDKEADWAARQLPNGVGVSDGIRQALKLLSRA